LHTHRSRASIVGAALLIRALRSDRSIEQSIPDAAVFFDQRSSPKNKMADQVALIRHPAVRREKT